MDILILSAIGLVLGTSITTSIRRRKLKKDVHKDNELPTDNLLNWKLPSTQLSKQEKTSVNNQYSRAGAAAAVGMTPFTFQSIDYLNQIDENFIEGLNFSTNEDLSNFDNLHNYISEKYTDALNSSSADGWLNRLEGYMTEQTAADYLTEMGYEVEFPSASNQEGYDLLVNGEPFQVKGGDAGDAIKEHLSQNPDIPVITNLDSASAFEGNDSVWGLEALEHDSIEQTATSSIEGVEGFGDMLDSAGVGIPIVTAITSGAREIKLLSSGKTDSTSSMKNASLDIAGTGGGGFAGAQTGALIGSAVFPGVGTVVGTVAGGIIGSIGGKSITNSVKRKPFIKATENLKVQIHLSAEEIDQYKKQAKRDLRYHFEQINEQLNKEKNDLAYKHKQITQHNSRASLNAQKDFIKEFPTILSSIEEQLHKNEVKLLSKMKRSNLLKRIIFPSYEDVYYDEAKNWFKSRYSLIENYKKKFSKLPTDDEQIQKQYRDIINFFKTYQTDNRHLNQELIELLNKQQKVKGTRQQAIQEMVNLLRKADLESKKQTKKAFKDIFSFIQRQQTKINELQRKVKIEADKLGL